MCTTKKFAVLKEWNPVRGYGFIRIINEDKSVTRFFLHISQIIKGEPVVGSGVYFKISDAPVKPGNLPAAVEAEIGEVLPKFKPQPAVIATEVQS